MNTGKREADFRSQSQKTPNIKRLEAKVSSETWVDIVKGKQHSNLGEHAVFQILIMI